MDSRSEHPQSPEHLDNIEVPGFLDPEKKLCANCNKAVPVTPDTWAFKRGGAPLKICKPCWHARKAESAQAALQPKPVTKPTKPKLPVAAGAKDIKAAARLDVAQALKAGARVLNDQAEMVLARVLSYAADPNHPQHWDALKLLTDRILPRKLFEVLGGEAAGVGHLQDKRPQFVVQILPATLDAPAGRVIEGEGRVVEVLPASVERSE